MEFGMSTGVSSWSRQYRGRKEIASRFGPVFSLPLAKRASGLMLETAQSGDRVLEVGAGDRRKGDALRRRFQHISYKSLDIDTEGDHEFRNWSQVDESFDLIFAFEVVEHIGIDDLPDFLGQAADHLAPGGRLLLSTPNIFYPPDFLRDVTHRTPLCYDELGSLVESTGLRTENIFRIHHDPLHRLLLKRYAFGWLFRMLGIDYAKQIVLIAEKPAAVSLSMSRAA